MCCGQIITYLQSAKYSRLGVYVVHINIQINAQFLHMQENNVGPSEDTHSHAHIYRNINIRAARY